MELIAQLDGRRYFSQVVPLNKQDMVTFGQQPFVLLLHIDQKDFDRNSIHVLAEDTLASNARYIVCAGNAAELVHDIFDAVIEQQDWDAKRRETIMTTWLSDNAIEDVVFHLRHLAFAERSELKTALLLFHNNLLAQQYASCLVKSMPGSKGTR